MVGYIMDYNIHELISMSLLVVIDLATHESFSHLNDSIDHMRRRSGVNSLYYAVCILR